MGVWVLSLLLVLSGRVAGKVVDAKGAPVPAAAVHLTAAAGAPSLDTVTEPDGTFEFAEAPSGSCTLSVEMAGFQKIARPVDPGADEATRLSITLIRTSTPHPVPGANRAPGAFPGPRMGRESRPAFAEIEMSATDTASTSGGEALTADSPAPAPQSDSSDLLVITGNASASLDSGDWNDQAFRARMADMGQRMGFGEFDRSGLPGQGERGEGGPGMGPAGPGGPGGGPGMGGRGMGGGPPMGGPMGGRGFGAMGGRSRQRQPKLNVSVFSNYRNSALNAKSYSLTGADVSKPLQIQNNIGLSVGGILPWGSAAQGTSRRMQQPGMWFFSYEGSRNRNPFDVLTTVPTELERAGDFSQTSLGAGQTAGQGVAIYDPESHDTFAGGRIPASRLNPAAVALLRYFPLPNLAGSVQNFTMQRGLVNTSDSFSGRVNTRLSAKDNAFVNYTFRRGNSLTSQIFPGLDTDRNNRAQNLGIGGVHRFQPRLILNYRVSLNRVRTSSTNPFSYADDVEGALGISGVSQRTGKLRHPHDHVHELRRPAGRQPGAAAHPDDHVGGRVVEARHKAQHPDRWGPQPKPAQQQQRPERARHLRLHRFRHQRLHGRRHARRRDRIRLCRFPARAPLRDVPALRQQQQLPAQQIAELLRAGQLAGAREPDRQRRAAVRIHSAVLTKSTTTWSAWT